MALPILLILLMVGTGLGDGLRQFTFWGVFNQGVVQLILLIGAFTWYYPARVARAQMLTLRPRRVRRGPPGWSAPGGRGSSASTCSRTSSRHSSSSGAIMVATALMLEVGVTFLGAGITLPTASWGTLLGQQWGSALNRRSRPAEKLPALADDRPQRRDPAHRARAEPARRGHARGARPGGGALMHAPAWFAFVLRRLISSIVLLLLLTLVVFFAFSKIRRSPPRS